jgi:predicted nucleic acid-binding protein
MGRSRVSKVFWDTNIFIYLFDGESPFLPAVRNLRERMLTRGDELVTSAMTVAEIQVLARRQGNVTKAEYLRDLVKHSGKVIEFGLSTADMFSHLRATTSLRPADAIQLSCAAAVGVELFVTNDKSLHNLSIPGIHFITPLERVPI